MIHKVPLGASFTGMVVSVMVAGYGSFAEKPEFVWGGLAGTVAANMAALVSTYQDGKALEKQGAALDQALTRSRNR